MRGDSEFLKPLHDLRECFASSSTFPCLMRHLIGVPCDPCRRSIDFVPLGIFFRVHTVLAKFTGCTFPAAAGWRRDLAGRTSTTFRDAVDGNSGRRLDNLEFRSRQIAVVSF